jgi:hypothetical protein
VSGHPGRFGVAITTTVDGKSVLEQTIIADGSAQPLSQRDCSGTQTSNWSRDGERLFTNVELTCAGRPKRVISGITLWPTAVGRLAGDGRRRHCGRARTAVSAIERWIHRTGGYDDGAAQHRDIIEASAKVQSEALEAVLDEANARFELNSRVLTQLADNGVSRNVIDLMVAQAYPEKFRIERPSSTAASTSYGTASTGGSTAYMGSSMMYPDPMYDPFYSSYYYYSPFAYSYYWGPSYVYRYGSPFYPNYSHYNYYGVPGGGYYYGGGIGSGDNIAPPGSPDSPGGNGVVVNGRGYTRVRPAGSANTPLAKVPHRQAARRVPPAACAAAAAPTPGPARARAPVRHLRLDRQGRRRVLRRVEAAATPAAAEVQAAGEQLSRDKRHCLAAATRRILSKCIGCATGGDAANAFQREFIASLRLCGGVETTRWRRVFSVVRSCQDAPARARLVRLGCRHRRLRQP